ncbi:MAG: Trigger factor [candidate division WS6 bacterium GW2011_GWC2_36_7]|uniref:Trigger factor n=1 Tax=candidate division WS6 bacterium GW2011_GWC2_36_7 TaxID=1619091 RepID=A0A0G0FBX6_9BACT|nr:MAG: Trigger factor [candidate division WS6 bacterium GW2011_GWC2_36_7]
MSKDTIEFTITIPKDSFNQSYEAMMKDKVKDTDIKGFRKGKVPTKMVETQLSQSVRLETLEKIAPLYISTAIQKEALDPIAPLTIVVTVMPEFKLANLKKIKVEKEEATISKKEIDEAIDDIKKNYKTKEKEINDAWAVEVAKMIELPEVKDMKELRKQIEDAMKAQKEHMLLHKRQEKALDEAIKLCEIEIPKSAIMYEARERERSFRYDMEQKGVKAEEFMKSQNLTIEKMRELWENDSKEALQTDTFLKMYMKEHNIDMNEEELAERIGALKKNAPKGTDMSVYDDENWQAYVKNVDLKQRAFEEFIKEVLGEMHKD